MHSGYHPKGSGSPIGQPPHSGSSGTKPVDEIRFVGELRRVDIKPGDKFVLRFDQPLSLDAIARFQSYWERFAGPGVPLLVLDSHAELSVINAEGR